MEFTNTERGQRKILRNGYIYVHRRNNANGFSTWECILRRKGSQCNAKVRVSPNDEVVEQTNEHSHPPSEVECLVTKVKAGIKRRAETTEEPAQQVIAAELGNISEGTAANLPSLSTIRRNIRHIRQDRDLLPNPISRADIPELPPQYTVTANGDPFLIFDSGVGDQERFFVFASPQALQLLANSEHWYADGTFKVCPEVFYQLYTVHGQRNGAIFPCVFALLPNKTENTYNRLFQVLFDHVNPLGPGPNDVLVDFEKSAINAFENRGIDVKCCFFHLSSNIWKHIQNLGLALRYNQDEEFGLHLRMVSALAFLPPGDVIDGFEELSDNIQELYGDAVGGLLEYFEDTYIGRFRRNAARRPPIFATDLWNMFHRTDDELPRTNNSVEGWHRSFQIRVSSCHPIFWKFLSVLQKEESMIRVAIIMQIAGHQDPPQRQRYLDCGRRIVRIVDDYPNRQRLQYLRGIAHNLSF